MKSKSSTTSDESDLITLPIDGSTINICVKMHHLMASLRVGF